MNICKDCVHHELVGELKRCAWFGFGKEVVVTEGTSYCAHPALQLRYGRNPVSGAENVCKTSCREQRGASWAACGKDGRYFSAPGADAQIKSEDVDRISAQMTAAKSTHDAEKKAAEIAYYRKIAKPERKTAPVAVSCSCSEPDYGSPTLFTGML